MWKVLAILALGLIALVLFYPLIKNLIWLGIIALALYGAFALFVESKTKSK